MGCGDGRGTCRGEGEEREMDVTWMGVGLACSLSLCMNRIARLLRRASVAIYQFVACRMVACHIEDVWHAMAR